MLGNRLRADSLITAGSVVILLAVGGYLLFLNFSDSSTVPLGNLQVEAEPQPRHERVFRDIRPQLAPRIDACLSSMPTANFCLRANPTSLFTGSCSTPILPDFFRLLLSPSRVTTQECTNRGNGGGAAGSDVVSIPSAGTSFLDPRHRTCSSTEYLSPFLSLIHRWKGRNISVKLEPVNQHDVWSHAL